MTEPVPWLNLKRQYLTITDEVKAAIGEVLNNTAFAGGPFVERFEQQFAQYCGSKYCVGLNSGTAAIHFALLALGVKEGDEVLVPSNTFIASVWGLCYIKAKPIFVDCDPDTWNISPEDAKKKTTKKTKGIIAVHLYGQPFDVDAIRSVTKGGGLFLLEDAAQGHGATFKGKRTGTFGDLGCFSFYPGKNLGAFGEGGGVTTDNKAYADLMKCYRDQGQSVKYYHEEIGYNERMDGIQGAVLSVKLKYLEGWNKRRQDIAKRYQSEIKNQKIKMQKQPDGVVSVYHLFVITTEDREGFQKFLNEKGVTTGLHYPVPCHMQNALSYLGYKKGDLPNSEYLADHCVTLPMFPELTDDEVGRVIDACNAYK